MKSLNCKAMLIFARKHSCLQAHFKFIWNQSTFWYHVVNGPYRAINPILQAFDGYSWEQFYRRRIYQTRAWSWWQWQILFRQTLQFYTHSCFIKTFYIWGNLYFHIILWYDIRHDLLMLINIFANPLKKSRSYGYSVHATCFIPFELQRRLFDISLLHLFSNFICRTRNSSLRSRYLKFTKFTQSAKVKNYVKVT